MTYSFDNTSLNDYLFPNASMFGKNSGTDMFGVPADKLRAAGQSSSTDADKLELQNKYASNAAQSELNTSLQAKQSAANIDARTYQQKTATDSQNALVNAQNATTVQDRHGYAGGSVAGYSDGLYNYTPQIGGSPYMPTVTMQQHLNPQVAIMQLQNQMGQEDANNQLQRSLATSDRDRYNQGLMSEQQYQQQSNLQSNQLASQRDLAQLDANTRLGVAQTDANSRLGAANIGAQGSVLSSLFGSISGGAINGRYW